MIIKKYAPHIDGLRALAVLPVILFHADFELFKGGYVGVDIFFVISGYLITNIIIFDLQKNAFSIKDFYLRRSRRILPALFFVVLISLVLGIFIIPESEISFFSKQALSVVIFLSNFFFWKNTGYFSPNSDLQPLLHTWSLAVEEQFYIFFPIFLLFVWKLKFKKIFYILLTISGLSFLLSQLGGNFKIQNLNLNYPFFNLPFEIFWQAGSANFYLPFGRIWELLAGSLVSIYLFNYKINNRFKNNFLSLLGVSLILISIFLYGDGIQYPSIFTLLPVVGTVLIILFATNNTVLNKVLSFKPIVFLGLISYSFYLIHQPMFAFNRIYFGVNLSFFHSLFIILVSFILAIFSWKFIETPFRQKNKVSNKNLIKSLGTLSAVIISISFLMNSHLNKFKKEKLSQIIINSFETEKSNGCFDLEFAHLKDRNWFCKIGDEDKKISFVLTGDSHALAIKPGFHKAAIEKNLSGIFVGYSGCPSLINVFSVRPDQRQRNCKKLNDKIFLYVKQKNINKIFLVSKWSYYTEGNYEKTNFNYVSQNENMFSNKRISRKAIQEGLRVTLEKYNQIGTKVYLVDQIPLQVYDPKYAFSRSSTSGKVNLSKLNEYGVEYSKHKIIQKFITTIKDELREDYQFENINFDKYFCGTGKCKIGDQLRSYYIDKNHLSIKGANKLTDVIKDFL